MADQSGGHLLAGYADVVEAGYNAVADTHLNWIEQIEGDPRLRYVDELLGLLTPPATILELGCGAGVPVTQRLAQSHHVTGVDLSVAQLELARRLVPDATFVHSDMTRYRPSEAQFDAVVAIYSLSHVPRQMHETLFSRIVSWLKPGGFFLASLGANGCSDTVEEWLGVPMFFSSHDAAENRRLLKSAGLSLLVDDVVTMQEPEGSASFLWVLAQRP